MLGQCFSAFEILAFNAFPQPDGVILVAVGRRPLFVCGQVTESFLGAFGADIHFGGLKDGLAVEFAVRGILRRRLCVPGLAARVGVLQQIEDFHVPMMGIATIGFGLDVVPPHVFLAAREGPGRLAAMVQL